MIRDLRQSSTEMDWMHLNNVTLKLHYDTTFDGLDLFKELSKDKTDKR